MDFNLPSDLVAYLKVLGSGLDPGLTESTIEVGVILPPPRAMGGTGAAIERVLAAYFKELNDSGGIYNRRIALRFADPSAPDGLVRLRGDQVFAVAASFVAGVEGGVVCSYAHVEMSYARVCGLYPEKRPSLKSKPSFTIQDAFV